MLLCAGLAWAQDVTLTARVELLNGDKAAKPREAGECGGVADAGRRGAARPVAVSPGAKSAIGAKNKSFEPHVLVVPVGSVVAFPNRDPFFHNVFSLFEGKRFDLGLYEAGSTRDVTLTSRESPTSSAIFIPR